MWEGLRCHLAVGVRCLYLTFQTPSLGQLVSSAVQICWWREGLCREPGACWPFSKACPHQGRRRSLQPIPPRGTASAILASLGVVLRPSRNAFLSPLPYKPHPCHISGAFMATGPLNKDLLQACWVQDQGWVGAVPTLLEAPSIRPSNHRCMCGSASCAEHQEAQNRGSDLV